MESNAKGQIAKSYEMVLYKIGNQVLYSLSHGSNRIDSKQCGPSVISQIRYVVVEVTCTYITCWS